MACVLLKSFINFQSIPIMIIIIFYVYVNVILIYIEMDADYDEDTVETHIPGKKRKHMSKFKRAIKKKKPKFDPG